MCLQALRLLQSLLVEGEVVAQLTLDLLRSLPMGRIRQLTSSRHAALSQTARETLEDLERLAKNESRPIVKEQ